MGGMKLEFELVVGEGKFWRMGNGVVGSKGFKR